MSENNDEQQLQHDEHQAPDVGLSPRELWEQQNAEATAKLNELAQTVTQREWLLITRALDRTRSEVGADTGLTLLALAWVKEKREHELNGRAGGASWDKLLDLTDAQLEAVHGFPAGDGTDLDGPTTS